MGGDVAHQIANAHVTFNLVGALLMVLCVGPVGALLQRFVPDTRPAVAASLQRAPREAEVR